MNFNGGFMGQMMGQHFGNRYGEPDGAQGHSPFAGYAGPMPGSEAFHTARQAGEHPIMDWMRSQHPSGQPQMGGQPPMGGGQSGGPINQGGIMPPGMGSPAPMNPGSYAPQAGGSYGQGNALARMFGQFGRGY